MDERTDDSGASQANHPAGTRGSLQHIRDSGGLARSHAQLSPALSFETLGPPPPHVKNTDGRQKDTMLFPTFTQGHPWSWS